MIIGFRIGLPHKQILEFGRVHPSVHAERPLKLLYIQYVTGLCKAKKCLLADFFSKSACEAG